METIHITFDTIPKGLTKEDIDCAIKELGYKNTTFSILFDTTPQKK